MAKIMTEEQKDAYLKSVGLKSESSQPRITLDKINSFGDKESLKGMLVRMGKYNKMLKERITFINDSLTATVPFTRENLYLFCAYTGCGKSTIAANISYPLWKQGKKILVLSNEESAHDVIFRIACLELGYNFNDWKKGKMTKEEQIRASQLMPVITQFVKVIDVEESNGLTTRVEGVKDALEQVKNQDFSCVLIDYFQLIKYSETDKAKKAYDNLNDLRIWIGQYIKSANVPIVLFVQLYSQSKRQAKGHDLDARIKDCSAIVEPATVIVEVIPNFEEQTTDFVIHKDRFGAAGARITCPFSKGRYLKQVSVKEQAERKLDELVKDIEDGKQPEKRPALVSDLPAKQ